MKVFFNIYTTDGREWETIEQDLDEEAVENWSSVLANLKALGHIYFPVADAVGRQSSIHFHPDKIVAIRITEVS